MSPEVQKLPDKKELTPSQKLDAYISTLADKVVFDYMEDRLSILTVKRSADSTHSEPWPDSDWALTITGTDPETGARVGIVEKLLHSDDIEPARKKVVLDKAFAYSAEIAKARMADAEPINSENVTGASKTESIEPFNDPFSDAMTKEEIAAIRAEVDAAMQPESDVDDYHARLSEAQAKQKAAFAEQLKAEQAYGVGSYEFSLAHLVVEDAKKDVEGIMREQEKQKALV
jgi:hypothetical protein